MAILAQGCDLNLSKPVVIASRTSSTEKGTYSQLDLEATAIDFPLKQFRNYQVGVKEVKIATDRKPLCSIFNMHRRGLIQNKRMKLRHQGINYYVEYQQGKMNQSDYLLRHGKPFSTLPENEKMEAGEQHNLLYTRLQQLLTK